MLVSSTTSLMFRNVAQTATTTPVRMVVTWGVRCLGCTLAAHFGSRPSRAIEKKMRGWPSWKTSSTPLVAQTAPKAMIPEAHVMLVRRERRGQRLRGAELLPRQHAGEHHRHGDVDDRADDEAGDHGDGHVALRVLRFLGRRRHRVEADVGEEDDRRRARDAAEAVGREGHPVGRLDVEGADDAEEDQDRDVHHRQRPGQPRALADAHHQHPRDAHHDQERRQVQDHRDAEDDAGPTRTPPPRAWRRCRGRRRRRPAACSWARCSAAFAAVG